MFSTKTKYNIKFILIFLGVYIILLFGWVYYINSLQLHSATFGPLALIVIYVSAFAAMPLTHFIMNTIKKK